jgi:transcriptional regulator with XRE-family HTH domain
MTATPHRVGPTVTLGVFLRDRRARVTPAASPSPSRRRTPGLRREEVAARAGVSITWYTWLEQGRGGPPSEDALERIARALELDRAGREMLFLLAQQRPPRVEPTATPTTNVPKTVRRVLDALSVPALVKTTTWDVLAWNEAMIPFRDFAKLTPRDRNTLRAIFLSPAAKARMGDWEERARAVVATFRMDVARIGGSAEATALVAELCEGSADFRQMWSENDVQTHAMGRKKIRHPTMGEVKLEYSSFPVDGAEGLSLVVFTAAEEE